MVAEKLDLTKTDQNYYKVGKNPEIRELDSYRYLTIQGQSSPQDELFFQAIETLYQAAYAIKFLAKAEDEDFVVPKMEGFWWIAGGPEAQKNFEITPQEEWFWKIMIRMPESIGQQHFDRAVETIRFKKSPDNLDQLKFEEVNEGKCAQVLHIGSYNEEKPTIDRLFQFINEQGLQIAGTHHEIYLSDPRKTAEERLKTIIRYAVK